LRQVRGGEHYGTVLSTGGGEAVVDIVRRQHAEGAVVVLGFVPGEEVAAV
jgi:hypothetical protein